ncbi:YjfB family protein [Virgibacillus byunsanensis]|uniref:YjfB family protein n=1 Tax=Virgibacillus byunsanensis TaxID=570945 RepID=A0ABW3LHB6_9BACI
MDVAAMSIALSNHQVKSESSLAVMSNVKGLAEQQGQQLVDMLQQSTGTPASHPSLGNRLDVKI